MKALKVFLTVGTLILAVCLNAYCLNVAPGKIEITIAPSNVYEGALAIRNTDQKALVVTLRTEDWFKAVEGVQRGTGGFNWLRIRPLSFELEAGGTRQVKYKVSVPKTATGELNAMIFVDAKPNEISEGAIGINTSIGIPIYVMIKGTEVFKASVEELKVINNSPLELAVEIKNSGNVHIRPTGTIVIARSSGQNAADQVGTAKQSQIITIPLNEYNYPVLPNSSREIEIKSQRQLEPGGYVADIKMGFDDRKYSKKVALKIE